MSESRPLKELFLPFLGLSCLLVLTLCIYYSPAAQSEFLNWDDDLYITKNKYYKSENALKHIWVDQKMPNPYPITFSTIALQYQFFGLNSAKFHFVNLAIHLLNVILWWLVLRHLKLKGFVLFTAVALYALHPVQVESVMWISEVKNLLSALFYWLSFLAFLKFFEEGHKKAKKWTFYSLGVFAFICSLLSKSMTVTFPVSLTLWVFLFHRDSFMKKFALLIPLYLLSLWCGIASMGSEDRYYTTSHHEVLNRDVIERVHDVTESLYFYLWKFIVPLDLACIYPQNPLITPKTWQSFLATLLLAALILGLLWSTHWIPKFSKLGAFCILNYGIVAGPILGFLSTSYMPLSKVSDRYNYHPLPFLGLGCILLLIPLWNSLKNIFLKVSFSAICTAGLLFFCWNTHSHAWTWSNSVNLWQQAVKVDSKQVFSLHNLGMAYWEQRNLEKASEAFQNVFKLDPKFYKAYSAYGCLLIYKGEVEKGRVYLQNAEFISPGSGKDYFRQYLLLDPGDGKGWSILGVIYQRLGLLDKAGEYFEKAIHSPRPSLEPLVFLGEYYLKKNQVKEAKHCFERAINEKIDVAQAHINLALISSKEYSSASTHIKAALKIAPDNISHWLFAQKLYHNLQKYREEKKLLEFGIQQNPKDPTLKIVYARFLLLSPEKNLRNLKQAFQLLEPLKPFQTKNAFFLETYGIGLFQKREFTQAIQTIKSALLEAKTQNQISFLQSGQRWLFKFRTGCQDFLD